MPAAVGLGTPFAVLGLSHINALVALITGLCGLVVALPAAIRTIRDTDWKTLFRRRP